MGGLRFFSQLLVLRYSTATNLSAANVFGQAINIYVSLAVWHDPPVTPMLIVGTLVTITIAAIYTCARQIWTWGFGACVTARRNNQHHLAFSLSTIPVFSVARPRAHPQTPIPTLPSPACAQLYQGVQGFAQEATVRQDPRGFHGVCHAQAQAARVAGVQA